MKTIPIRDLIVPLDEYAPVREDASLADAILELERAQQEFDHTKYRHRAVLVLDAEGQPIEVETRSSVIEVTRAGSSLRVWILIGLVATAVAAGAVAVVLSAVRAR